jgi:hypothetical protein
VGGWVQEEAGVLEDGQLEDEGAAAMALYARVFVLKVRGRRRGSRLANGRHDSDLTTFRTRAAAATACRGAR